MQTGCACYVGRRGTRMCANRWRLHMPVQWTMRSGRLRSMQRPMHTRCTRQWSGEPLVMHWVRVVQLMRQAMRARVPQATCLRRRSRHVSRQARCLVAILG